MLLRLATVCLVLGVFFAPFAAVRLPGVFFTLSDFFLTASAIAIVSAPKSTFQIPKSLTIAWVGGAATMVTALLASSIMSGDAVRGVVVTVQYAYSLLLVPALVLRLGPFVGLQKLTWAWLLGIAAVAALGSYFHVTGTGQAFTSGGRMGSLLENPNRLAKSIAASLPLWVLLFARSNLRRKLILVLCLAIFAGGLLVSSSFSGLLLASGAVALAVTPRNLPRLGSALALLAAVAFASGFELPEIFKTRILEAESVDQYGSLADKVLLARQAYDMASSQGLLGIGPDEFTKFSILRVPVHNTYLLVWVEGGMLALTGWVILALTLAVTAVVGAYRSTTIAVASVAVFLAGCMTNTHVYARFWLLPVFLSLAIALAQRTALPRSARLGTRAPSTTRAATAISAKIARSESTWCSETR